MARQPTGNPNGRPPKEINWEQFENLCGLQCTQSEISSFLKIDKHTLIDSVQKNYGEPFSTVYKQFSENGLCSLRRTQFVLAKKNASMAIHLGKHMLGQKDMIINVNQDTKPRKKLVAPDNGRRGIVK